MKCFNVSDSSDSVIGFVADVCRTPELSIMSRVLVLMKLDILRLSTLFLGFMMIPTSCGCLLVR